MVLRMILDAVSPALLGPCTSSHLLAAHGQHLGGCGGGFCSYKCVMQHHGHMPCAWPYGPNCPVWLMVSVTLAVMAVGWTLVGAAGSNTATGIPTMLAMFVWSCGSTLALLSLSVGYMRRSPPLIAVDAFKGYTWLSSCLLSACCQRKYLPCSAARLHCKAELMLLFAQDAVHTVINRASRVVFMPPSLPRLVRQRQPLSQQSYCYRAAAGTPLFSEPAAMRAHARKLLLPITCFRYTVGAFTIRRAGAQHVSSHVGGCFITYVNWHRLTFSGLWAAAPMSWLP